jgi:cytochrome P450
MIDTDPAMVLNPYAGHYCTDPATVWQDLLDHPAGVRCAEDLDLWVITRHALVRHALADTRTFSNALTLAPVYTLFPEAADIVTRIDAPPTTAAADAPTHTRTRAALRASFANTGPRVVARYGPIVRHRVDQLVTALAARRGQTVDLVAELTTVLPLLVIVDILGIPEPDIPRIKAWADGQIALVWGNPPPAEQVRLAHGLLDFWHYCQHLVCHQAADGACGDDLISTALRYRDGRDDVLTLDEVASLAFNLLVAGHETTAGLLAHTIDQALSTPDTWQHLAHSDFAGRFVEETLRMRPPIDGWLRVTTRTTVLGGVEIPAGARCLLLIGAANRDPHAFATPRTFAPHRADAGNHLAFGYGPHFCIGAALARLEARTALSRLATDLPAMRLAAGHRSRYLPNVAFRAHKGLSVVMSR